MDAARGTLWISGKLTEMMPATAAAAVSAAPPGLIHSMLYPNSEIMTHVARRCAGMVAS
jgi:hypothetical protein